MKSFFFSFIISTLLLSCTSNNSESTNTQSSLDSMTVDSTIVMVDTIPTVSTLTPIEIDSILSMHDTSWVDIEVLEPNIVLDIRYATTNNFMELQIYDCPKCLIRLKAARELLNANAELNKQGLGFKMFDCYRPSSAQYKLWKKTPDPRFVANPKKGSMHSRGGALDLTLIDLATGEQLDMGTHYDYFGRKAYWVNQDLPDTVLANRQLLRKTMYAHGFKTVTTEWWHFSYRRAWFKLSDRQWDCD